MAVTATFEHMRLHLTLLGMVVALAACGDGSDGATRSAAAMEQAATQTAAEAFPLAARAIGGTELRVHGRWRGCSGGVGHQYTGAGLLTAPAGAVAEQLEAMRAALTGAGFTDVSKVDGHVSVERDGIELDVQEPAPARDPRSWRLAFRSPCATYSGTDEELVESDPGNDFEGLTPQP